MTKIKPISQDQRVDSWNKATMTHKKPARMTLASSNSYLSNSYDHSRENLFGQIFNKAVALFEKHPVIGFLIIVMLGILVSK